MFHASTERLRQFYCRESYSIWLREVYSKNVEVVEDTYRDYLQYSTLTGVEVIQSKPAEYKSN